jgi:hypothetical protein
MTTKADTVLDYERLNSKGLLDAIQLFPGEHLLVLRPFGWHLDGSHMPNQAEHFSRESVCADQHLEVVCQYGPYIAVVRQARGQA